MHTSHIIIIIADKYIRCLLRLWEGLFISASPLTSPSFYSAMYPSCAHPHPLYLAHTDAHVTPSQTGPHSCGSSGIAFLPRESLHWWPGSLSHEKCLFLSTHCRSKFPSRQRSFKKYGEDLFPWRNVGGQERVMAKSVSTTRGLLFHMST